MKFVFIQKIMFFINGDDSDTISVPKEKNYEDI